MQLPKHNWIKLQPVVFRCRFGCILLFHFVFLMRFSSGLGCGFSTMKKRHRWQWQKEVCSPENGNESPWTCTRTFNARSEWIKPLADGETSEKVALIKIQAFSIQLTSRRTTYLLLLLSIVSQFNPENKTCIKCTMCCIYINTYIISTKIFIFLVVKCF